MHQRHVIPMVETVAPVQSAGTPYLAEPAAAHLQAAGDACRTATVLSRAPLPDPGSTRKLAAGPCATVLRGVVDRDPEDRPAEHSARHLRAGWRDGGRPRPSWSMPMSRTSHVRKLPEPRAESESQAKLHRPVRRQAASTGAEASADATSGYRHRPARSASWTSRKAASRAHLYAGWSAGTRAAIQGPVGSSRRAWTPSPRPAVQRRRWPDSVGDAAGWNDPILGLGLSITYRDVRIVSDLLLGDDDWASLSFAPYAEERAERMRRLRFVAICCGPSTGSKARPG